MKKILTRILVLHLFCNILQAQPVVNIQHIQLEDGLSDQVVYGGYQDDQGFVWLATRKGLNRYDGHAIQSFRKSTHGLQEEKIIQLTGRANTLFLLYGEDGSWQFSNGKIDVFSTINNHIQPLDQYLSDIPFRTEDIVWVSSDAFQQVFFFTSQQAIWRLDPTNQWTQISCQNHCDAFEFTSNSNHLAYGNFVGISSMTKQQTIIIRDTTAHLISGKNNTWFNVFIEREVRPLKFENSIVNEYDLKGKVPEKKLPYSIEILSKDIPFFHYNDPIAAKTLIYHPEKGLYVLGPKQSEFLTSKAGMRLHEDQINSFFMDRNDQYWLCTTTGIYIIQSFNNQFESYFTAQSKGREPLVTDQIRGISLDEEGRLYACVWNQLGRVRHNTGQIEYLPNARNAILYSLHFHRGKMYGGSTSLVSFNQNEQVREHVYFENHEIWSLGSLNDSLLFLGLSNDMLLFNTTSNRLSQLEDLTPDSHPIKYIYRFLKDTDDNFLAVGESGIYKISPAGKIIQYMGESTFGTEKFHDLHVDEDGIYWIAGTEQGLIRYLPHSGQIKTYGRAQGFPSESLYRIESDPYGNLWISSQRGLIRFNKKSENVRIYLQKDGLPFDEFNRVSSYQSSDNILYFGGLNGLVTFDPKTFQEQSVDHIFQIKLSSIQKFSLEKNDWIHINEFSDLSNTLTIHPQDRLFNIAFSMLDFQSGTYLYSYKFEGLDNQWNLLEDNIIRLTGLPHGQYKLMVKGINPNGIQTDEIQLLEVKVLAPFYIRWWFIFLCCLILIALIIWIIKWRVLNIKEENLQLEKVVSTRTKELAKMIEYKDILLKEVQHRIKNNLAIMDSMLELQKEKITDEDAIEAFDQSQRRLQSISLIHQNLSYKGETSEVNLRQFIEDLVQQSHMIVSGNSTDIKYEVDLINDWMGSEKAIPLGLILNELLTNSFKYARVPTHPLNIHISLKEESNQKIRLTYQDNGPGITNIEKLKENSLGIRLIFLFCRQLSITPLYDNANGSSFTFVIEQPSQHL